MYHGDDAKFNNIEFLQQLYMNSISESCRRYDVARHVKRTSKYFAPKEVFFESAAEKEENTILENQGINLIVQVGPPIPSSSPRKRKPPTVVKREENASLVRY